MSVWQYTIENPVRAVGIGLHSGERVSLKILPAPVNTGIRFVRTDLDPVLVIPARPESVLDTRFATTLGTEQGSVGTVEHLMAALAGVGIDNVLVELDGPEVPAMDGSAYPFITLLYRAGLRIQNQARRYMEILEPVSVSSQGKSLTLRPARDFTVSLEIDFDHPLVARQRFSAKITPIVFERLISRARTFGFLNEIQSLRKSGLALGGSLENAVVVGDNTVLNEGGLRFPDEFVRHKVLDLIGDLALLGAPILGAVHAERSGHALHYLLTRELLSRPSAWRLVTRGRSWEMPSWAGAPEQRVSAPVPA